jgi:hypothetical protein
MRILPTLLAAMLFAGTARSAILRVNNSGAPAPYTTFSAAHTAAQPGDTIHVEASPINYGSNFISKQLVIIGPGYFLGENAQTQAGLASATFQWLSWNSGGEGTVVSGVTFSSQTTINRSNIRIERCRFLNNLNFYHSSSLSGIQVIGCYVQGNLTVQSGSAVITDITMANNIFLGTLSQSASMAGEFVNNTVRNTSTDPVFSLSNMIARNNIFDCEVTPGNNTFLHNLFRTAPVPAVDGNQVSVDMSTMFGGGTVDNQWQLAPGSPAIAAGDNGEDCGAFGGNEPYRLSGIPAVPSIFGMTAPSTISVGATLPVTMSARTNE